MQAVTEGEASENKVAVLFIGVKFQVSQIKTGKHFADVGHILG